MNSSVNTVGIIFVKIDKGMVFKITTELMSFFRENSIFIVFKAIYRKRHKYKWLYSNIKLFLHEIVARTI